MGTELNGTLNLRNVEGTLRSSNRRHFLATSVVSSLSLAALSHGKEEQLEQKKVTGSPLIHGSPHVYKFKIGDAEAWSISDSFFAVKEGVNMMWPVEERAAMTELLKTEGRDPDEGIPLYVNILVVRTSKETVIFDSGFGGKENERMGWLTSGLALAEIAPESVTAAFLSHSHGDHLNGFVRDDKATFPNAEIHLLQAEIDFWRMPEPDFSESHRDKSRVPTMVKSVRRHFDILEGLLTPHQGETTLLEGLVTVEPAPGHTIGHAAFRIRSGGEEFLHLMDLAHHDLLMFADPNWNIGFDHHPKQAVETRKAFWAEAAARGTRCYGFHLPFPGIGYIVKVGNGYRWAPEPWRW